VEHQPIKATFKLYPEENLCDEHHHGDQHRNIYRYTLPATVTERRHSYRAPHQQKRLQIIDQARGKTAETGQLRTLGIQPERNAAQAHTQCDPKD